MLSPPSPLTNSFTCGTSSAFARSQTLEPVDYAKENYTRALWFSEGVTSTAEEIIQLRAGLIDERQFLGNLGGEITELQDRPAHLTQSAEESSLDAWA